jgi:hypothetical protein
VKAKVIQAHSGEGQFPTFKMGTAVTITGAEDTHFLHWYPCEIEGYQTFIPDCFINNGVLLRDYNPTELVQDVGNIVKVQGIVNAWLLATNEGGQTGWIPAESVVSI